MKHIKSDRRQQRAMLEGGMRWIVEHGPGFMNRHARRAQAVQIGRALKVIAKRKAAEVAA